MRKFVRSYGDVRKRVQYQRRDGSWIDTIITFLDLGDEDAEVVVKKWNGRSWNVVAGCLGDKDYMNEIARKIIRTNKVSYKDFA